MLTSGISESEHRDHELTQSTLQLVPSTWEEAGRIWPGREDCFVYFVFICLFLEESELDYFCGFLNLLIFFLFGLVLVLNFVRWGLLHGPGCNWIRSRGQS